jgi:hypothetical protein
MSRFWSRDVTNECGLSYTVSSTGICEPDHTYHAFPSPFKSPPVALSLSSSGRFLALVDRTGLFSYSITPTRLFEAYSKGSYIDAFFVFEETVLVALSHNEVTFFGILPPRQLRTYTLDLGARLSATSFRNLQYVRKIAITFSDDSVHFFAFPELLDLDVPSDDVRPLGYIRPDQLPVEREPHAIPEPPVSVEWPEPLVGIDQVAEKYLESTPELADRQETLARRYDDLRRRVRKIDDDMAAFTERGRVLRQRDIDLNARIQRLIDWEDAHNANDELAAQAATLDAARIAPLPNMQAPPELLRRVQDLRQRVTQLW